MKRTTKAISEQVKDHSESEIAEVNEYEGNTEVMISTGSTLLDMAISGGRVEGGGLPGGILVEVAGPSGSAKTVLLCEIAGSVQRQGGKVQFKDPESRLNKQFARIFDLQPDEMDYSIPDTVPELFEPIREWEPEPKGVIHGIFGDSLAALSTKLEMEEGGDKFGMRRAKEFSEECRKTCRIITQRNFLMVCSNQVRQNKDAGMYGQKYVSPGGEAIGFYSSIRLRTSTPTKLKKLKKIKGKDVKRVEGIQTTIEVVKSSVWKPYRTAPIYVLFDYGIDDVRANLIFLRDTLGTKEYTVNGIALGKRIDEAIQAVETDDMEKQLKTETIALWHELESKFTVDRKKKQRV